MKVLDEIAENRGLCQKIITRIVQIVDKIRSQIKLVRDSQKPMQIMKEN